MLAVPYLSQFDESVPAAWRDRACGVTNVCMILRYLGTDEHVSVADLISEGESIRDAFGPRGWTHEGIIRLARNHGALAYGQEFKSRDAETEERFGQEGVVKIRRSVESGTPVMVSIQKENGSFHTVTVIGANDASLTYHDPETGPEQTISVGEFLKIWRRLAVFFEVAA